MQHWQRGQDYRLCVVGLCYGRGEVSIFRAAEGVELGVELTTRSARIENAILCSNVRIGEKASVKDCEFGTGFEAAPGGESSSAGLRMPMFGLEGRVVADDGQLSLRARDLWQDRRRSRGDAPPNVFSTLSRGSGSEGTGHMYWSSKHGDLASLMYIHILRGLYCRGDALSVRRDEDISGRPGCNIARMGWTTSTFPGSRLLGDPLERSCYFSTSPTTRTISEPSQTRPPGCPRLGYWLLI